MEVDARADGMLSICGMCADCGLEFSVDLSTRQLLQSCETLDRNTPANMVELLEQMKPVGMVC
jgi:hypothetical protein